MSEKEGQDNHHEPGQSTSRSKAGSADGADRANESKDTSQPDKQAEGKDGKQSDQVQQSSKPPGDGDKHAVMAKRRGPGIIFTVFAFLVLTAIGFIAILHLEQRAAIDVLFSQQNNAVQANAQLTRDLASQQGLVDSLETELASLSDTLQSQTGEIEQLNEELVNTRLRINTSQSGINQQWILAEAESQIRLAQQRLVVARDVRAAIALFVASDELLRRIDDIAVFPIRDALARDLSSLRAVPELDLQGLFLRLGAIGSRIETLTLEISENGGLAGADTITAGSSASNGYFDSLLDRLSEYVIIRRLDEPITPRLTAQEGYFIRQNIRLLLEQARLAMLRNEQEIYTGNIGQAMNEIQQFMVDDPVRRSVLTELTVLQDSRISTQVPTISATLNAFRSVMSSIGVDAPGEGDGN